MASRSSGIVASALALNGISSILIVVINKILYKHFAFPNLSLTCIHFVFTSVGLIICHAMNLFQPKSVPLVKMVPLALTFCGFVMFTNLSLEYNSVGTYQLIKTMTTPCIMFIQSTFYQKSFSLLVKATVVPIAVGVFLNSFYDLSFNLLGVIFASIGVLVTSLYQVWVGEKQHELQLNSMQLLYYQAPLSAGLLFGVVFFVDTPLYSFNGMLGSFPFKAFALVVFSGCVSFVVNLSIYWIIGKLSPLTYNMLGHLKFCSTMIVGYFLFQDPLVARQLLGIIITILGVVAYSVIRMKEQKTVLPPYKK